MLVLGAGELGDREGGFVAGITGRVNGELLPIDIGGSVDDI